VKMTIEILVRKSTSQQNLQYPHPAHAAFFRRTFKMSRRIVTILLNMEICHIVVCRGIAMQRQRDVGYTRAVSGQHVPAATDTHATEERRFLRGAC
jgi:hypothetical protein